MVNISPFRTPWTAALLLLLVIWSVWLLGIPAQMESQELPKNIPLDAIPKSPVGKPSFEHEDHGQSNAKDSTFKAPPATAEETHILTGKPASTASVVASSKAAVSSAASNMSPSSSDRPLVTYVFSETDTARSNLEFFLKHGLHGGADFIFILNGDTNISEIIPKNHPNVRYIKRPNTCFDLGAHSEVLMKDDLYKNYKRFILMNASIRGPFVPYWAGACWSDTYLDRVTEKIKLVGMTGNCWPEFHVQSMIWATDIKGISLLLNPPPDPSSDEKLVGISKCFDGWDDAVHGEIKASGIITRAGYGLDVLMTAFHGYDYVEKCDHSVNGDVLWEGKYEGFNLHPYETMFIKTNRNVDPIMVGKMTEWVGGRNYSSWDYCPS